MKSLILTTIFIITTLTSSAFSAPARLLRFPAIHNDQVVFSYAGDIYTVSARGGIARRLTSHIGYEMFPRFSPDGKFIAFTAQYDGNTEVYLMPAQGGVPKRLTYTATLSRDDVSDRMGPNNIVMGWTPDGKSVIFRSRMTSFNPFKGGLYTISLHGGMPQQLPVPLGGFCSLQGDKMAYNRVFREFRTWKRYRGGMADDIWIHDFKKHSTLNITNNPAQDIIPMWYKNLVFFISDRDEGRMNLFAYDLDKKTTTKITQFKEFDIKFPSLGNRAIIFENGGWLYRLDLPDDKNKRPAKPQKIDIQICEDLSIGRDKRIQVNNYLTNMDLAPDGKRALFGARGDIFTLPAQHGQPRNLTATPGIHERNSTWSPDGRWIAYISDATGEDELYIIPHDGSAKPKKITTNGNTYIYAPKWSPDSTKLLWSDRRLRLRYIDINKKKIVEITKASAATIRQYNWSPDSKWIVYVNPEWQAMNRLYLYHLTDANSFPVTDIWFNASSPVFSRSGKYLLFTSDRDFNPIYSRTEWNHAYTDMERIYLITLAADTPSPFYYQNDETEITQAPPASKPSKNKRKSNTKKKIPSKSKSASDTPSTEKSIIVRIDPEGILNRCIGLPIPPSSYSRLDSVGDTIYYTRNGYKDNQTLLFAFDLKEQKQTELGQVSSYVISADGKKMLARISGRYGIIDLPKSSAKLDETLDLSVMKIQLNRQAEWKQIFNESWRQMREFFHVPNMHGIDWAAVRDKYAPLVNAVNHRCDLTYIIGEMVGELNCGHAYVSGGDYPKAPRIKMGLLGAKISRDNRSGFYRIDSILSGQNWDPKLRSPLTEVGAKAKENDYIIAIDGTLTNSVDNIYKLMIDKANRQVELTLNSKPRLRDSHKTIIKPIADESELYYYNWVQTNIDKVNRATDGRVGYIHIPDMGVPGLNEFVKRFYPQLYKQALIIDVRGNGGGNVSPMIIERLRRQLAMITYSRNTQPQPNPNDMINGPLVCLCDEYSASDGDLFTYRFKHHKLGPVIGKTTWGGVVGISGSLPFLDGGSMMKPEHSRYDTRGEEYIIEGVGVHPDIVVDNDPWQEFNGNDQQLSKAIEVITQKLKTEYHPLPPLPPYPVK